MDVAPHPHIGLQTVTWLLEGEILRRVRDAQVMGAGAAARKGGRLWNTTNIAFPKLEAEALLLLLSLHLVLLGLSAGVHSPWPARPQP